MEGVSIVAMVSIAARLPARKPPQVDVSNAKADACGSWMGWMSSSTARHAVMAAMQHLALVLHSGASSRLLCYTHHHTQLPDSLPSVLHTCACTLLLKLPAAHVHVVCWIAR